MKEYIIKKGKHSAKGWNVGITLSRKLSFRSKLIESCLYYFGDNDDYDINKLFGFSTTWFHQRQSARVGWRCVGNKFEIVTYSYNNGKRENKETDVLGVVEPGEMFYCTIEDTEKEYIYTFNKGFDNKVVTKKDKKKKDWFFFHYLLFPYFGGNKVAPHKMNIFVEKL
jgi:hypothetical protein